MLLWAVLLFRGSLVFLSSILVLLLISLSVLGWRLLAILLVVVLLFLALRVELLWSSVWLPNERHGLGHQMWWSLESSELAAEWLWSEVGGWAWAQVLVWVETTESNDVSEAGKLDHWLWWHLIAWGELVIVVVVSAIFLVLWSVALWSFWHWW